MVDLWLQIEGTKLIFIMNISGLDFFKFASRMPQIAQILVSTFKIFWWSVPPDPLKISSFFFHEQFQALLYLSSRDYEKAVLLLLLDKIHSTALMCFLGHIANHWSDQFDNHFILLVLGYKH